MQNARHHRGRSIAAIIATAADRQRANPWRGALVAVGVAAASATLLAVFGGGLVASDLKARAALADVPPAERVIRVNWSGSEPEADLHALDAQVAGAVGKLTTGRGSRSMLLRETNLGGRSAVLAGVDDLDRWVRLSEGRLPGPCRPERCEVVRIIGEAGRTQGITGARLVEVGAAQLVSPVPFGDLTGQRAGLGQLSDTPVLVTGDRIGLSSLEALSFVYRTYAWTADIAPNLVHPWSIDDLVTRQTRANQALVRTDAAFRLAGPESELKTARDASRRAGARILLVGGAASALLVGFALLAAVSLRAQHREELDRLERRGAGRGLRFVFTLAERLWISLAGVVVGYVLAVAVVAGVARAASVDVMQILERSLLSGRGALFAGAIWLGVSALLVAVQRRDAAIDGARGVRPLDVVAVAAILAVVLSAARGGTDSRRLTDGETDPLLPLLPVLLALAAGIIAARVFAPLARWAESHLRGGPLRLRLALVAMARRPVRPALTAGFLVVGLGLGMFAQSYRATLERGNRDQAAFAVPRDVTVAQGTSLRPLAPGDRRIPAGADVAPVLRVPTSVRLTSIPIPGTVLGVPAERLASGRGWRRELSDIAPERLGRDLQPVRDALLAGPEIPAGTSSLTIEIARDGQDADLSLVVQDGRGEFLSLPLRPVAAGRYAATVPPDLARARVVAFEAGLSRAQSFTNAHADAEARGGDTVTARLRLGPLLAAPEGRPITDWDAWVGRGGMRVAHGGARPDVRYVLGAARRAFIRPPQRLDGAPLPVVISSSLTRALGGGRDVTFELAGGQVVTGRVVGTAQRIPTIPNGAFVVADARRLSLLIEADDPGFGQANEAWIDLARPEDVAGLGPLRDAGFSVDVRADRQATLAADPLGRGIRVALSGAAAVALALGLVALLLTVMSDLRDERRELRDLAAQGVPPGTIRGQLRIRGALIMGLGAAGGIILGIALSSLVVRLVRVAADTTTPVPPLVRVGGWAVTSLALVAYALLGVLAVAVATRRAGRHRLQTGAPR